jgi:hypothetical protein
MIASLRSSLSTRFSVFARRTLAPHASASSGVALTQRSGLTSRQSEKPSRLVVRHRDDAKPLSLVDERVRGVEVVQRLSDLIDEAPLDGDLHEAVCQLRRAPFACLRRTNANRASSRWIWGSHSSRDAMCVTVRPRGASPTNVVG